MDWNDVLADPALRDLPYKIELNERGQIVMSPASNRHSLQQGDLAYLLRQGLPEGRVLPRCSIDTPLGVKVADVAWASDAFLETHGTRTPYEKAPEICVEMLAPSNTDAEMREKTMLYLAKGAREVWLCSTDGGLRFFGHEGERAASRLMPDAPRSI